MLTHDANQRAAGISPERKKILDYYVGNTFAPYTNAAGEVCLHIKRGCKFSKCMKECSKPGRFNPSNGCEGVGACKRLRNGPRKCGSTAQHNGIPVSICCPCTVPAGYTDAFDFFMRKLEEMSSYWLEDDMKHKRSATLAVQVAAGAAKTYQCWQAQCGGRRRLLGAPQNPFVQRRRSDMCQTCPKPSDVCAKSCGTCDDPGDCDDDHVLAQSFSGPHGGGDCTAVKNAGMCSYRRRGEADVHPDAAIALHELLEHQDTEHALRRRRWSCG